jgi:hypothetical protein
MYELTGMISSASLGAASRTISKNLERYSGAFATWA